MDLLFLTVLDGGYMDHCKVKIPASSAGAGAPEFEADCSVANGAPVYTNNPNLNQLRLDWKAVWDLPLDTPTVPSHVVESEPGIGTATGRHSVPGARTGGTRIQPGFTETVGGDTV